MFRIGFGYDVHRLVEGRLLILGGVRVPYHMGLDGHSDADVLTHAIIDAILGAAGKGDIGRHFPDTEPAYEGISSLILLERTRDLVMEEGYALNNLDATVVAQEPRLAEYIPGICRSLARVLKADENRVNIKATTTEAMGFCGRLEGIEAYAVVSLALSGGRPV